MKCPECDVEMKRGKKEMFGIKIDVTTCPKCDLEFTPLKNMDRIMEAYKKLENE